MITHWQLYSSDLNAENRLSLTLVLSYADRAQQFAFQLKGYCNEDSMGEGTGFSSSRVSHGQKYSVLR